MSSRRKFIKSAAVAGAALGVGMPAISYGNILGANRRINVAVFGTNGRGMALMDTFAKAADGAVVGIGDVDKRAIEKAQQSLSAAGHRKATGNQDFRRFLDDKDVDAVVIATPDHWHAPMAILALQAGKHVYVEKPCSHNPAEGDMLVAAQKKYGKVVQMGNQTRSSVSLNKIVGEIHDGVIGRAYAGKAWYANSRGSIGTGKAAPVPEWLDWELWQGPAPRQQYMDNLVHYNWHWFWKYGTGELLNNGTHEIDMCRWALGVDYPTSIASTGGRYHFKDDWEAYDTQVVGIEYADGKTINWEGRSCNGIPFWGRGRGALIHGTEGSVMMDRDGYIVYDRSGKEVRREKEEGKSVSMGTAGGGSLDERHIDNFLATVNGAGKLNSPIEDANISVTTCHLGNIAHRVGAKLHLDTKTGKPKGNKKAKALWSREYAKGWAPKV